MTTDESYMKRALYLAAQAKGHTSPNPMVGAVIVKDGRIIGEGYHHQAGEPHAEVNAINSANESVEGATIYVTLEPCSHYGRTPPCSDLIIDKKLKRVVVAALDPNPVVSGSGIERIRNAGIEVVTGVLEEESRKLNEVFNYFITTKRPFVVMKYAMTLDGKIATETGESKWISSVASRNHAHHLRGQLSGIMVGIGTVLKDDPRLTCRVDGLPQPVRIVMDSQLKIPMDARVLTEQNKAETVILTTDQAPSAKKEALEKRGVMVKIVKESDGHVDLDEAMRIIGEYGVDSLLLEGGGTLNGAALKAGIVHKLSVYIAPKLLGGAEAISPVMGHGVQHMTDAYKVKSVETTRIEDDLHIEAYIDRSEN